MKRNNLILVVFLTCFLSPLLFAQNEPMKPRGNRPDGPPFMSQLNLSDQQSKEFDKLRTDMMKQAIAQNAKIATARVELLDLLRADQLDKALLEKKMSDVAQLEGQLRTMRLNHWFTVNKLLTADQQKIWKRALLMHAAGRHQGMADRGPRNRPFGRGQQQFR